MASLLNQLNHDHRRFMRLFACLKFQLNLYRNDDRVSPDFKLILSVLDYIQAYPEYYHHPAEDILFVHLLECDIPQSATIEKLLLEHQELESTTVELKSAYNSSNENGLLPSEQLLDSTFDYIDQQISHLNTERNAVYPIAGIYLCSADIERLQYPCATMEDPLFDAILDAKFNTLFQTIIATDKLTREDGFSFI